MEKEKLELNNRLFVELQKAFEIKSAAKKNEKIWAMKSVIDETQMKVRFPEMPVDASILRTKEHLKILGFSDKDIEEILY